MRYSLYATLLNASNQRVSDNFVEFKIISGPGLESKHWGSIDAVAKSDAAGVATANIASVHVLEKAGMTCEGVRRKILPIRGEWKDNFHFAIVEDDTL